VNFEHLFQVVNNDVTLKLRGMANPLAPQAFFIDIAGANLTALIEILKTTTDAKTLASPRVVVLNGQEARIQIGEKLGYRVTRVTETAAVEDVEFLDTGVVLTVTPRISRNGQVLMRVSPEVSSGEVVDGLPEEETTSVATDVLLGDGQGIVIGGLIQEKDSNIQSKIPWVGDVWLLGTLFQRRQIEKTRSEVIVALVPRVLPYHDEYALRDQCDTHRAATPLLEGPLCRHPRPWEPRLPDTINNPRVIRLPCIHGPNEHCTCRYPQGAAYR
jgi:type II secretory pathway component GspD/PulD (secretin)